MRNMTFILLSVLTPLALAAQSPLVNSANEDSTLAGIHTVGLLISDLNDALGGPLVAQIATSTQLELRKAGLRVVRVDSVDKGPTTFDALIQVMVFRRGRFAGDDVDMRYLVRQPVTLVRTGKALWETTWTSERRGQNQDARVAVPKMVTEAMNDFLGKWLDMNGR